jgi:hypothetical protein
MEGIHLAQDRVQWPPFVNMAMTLWIQHNSDTVLTGWTTNNFLRQTQLMIVYEKLSGEYHTAY